MKKIKVGLIQMSCSINKEKNLDKSISKIKSLAKKGVHIICLQELFSLVYFCYVEDYNYFKFAESIPGKTTSIFQDLSKELRVVLIISLFEKRANGIYYNTAVVIDANGTYLGKYRKMHIPDDPCYYEKFYFTPGDIGYKVFQTQYAKIGVLLCWDQWYPEAARIISLMGAEILFYPTSIGWLNSEKENFNQEQYNSWKIIQRAHSIANAIPVVTVNRVGKEENNFINFWGGSFVTNAFGTILYEASNHNEENIIQEIDLAEIVKNRIHWPFLRDRRIDSYKNITKRFIDEI